MVVLYVVQSAFTVGPFGNTTAITCTSLGECTSARPLPCGRMSAAFHICAGMSILPSFFSVPSEPAPPETTYTSLPFFAKLPRKVSRSAHGPVFEAFDCGMMLLNQYVCALSRSLA